MKRSVSTAWFYGLVGLLNLAVAAMFMVVHIPSEPAAVAYMTRPAVVRTELATVPATAGTPIQLVIPSLLLDLPVGVGSYNPQDASWTLDDTQAYYADVSLPVNNSNGTTLIYGHAQSPVFGVLPQIEPGAEAIVYTDNGYVFRYEYVSVKEVVPTDTTIFTAAGSPTLVLQTCVGPWDAYRGLFSFRFTSLEKR